jgi:integrase
MLYCAWNASKSQDHVVMSILGHSSINITKGIYGHVYPSMQKEAADKMGRALFGTE